MGGIAMPRGRRSNQNWEELKAAYQASGLTETEWCQQQGINIQTFHKHIGTNSAKADSDSKIEWMEVDASQVTAPTPTNGWLTIEYGALRMTVDAGYPVDMLSALLREMCAAC